LGANSKKLFIFITFVTLFSLCIRLLGNTGSVYYGPLKIEPPNDNLTEDPPEFKLRVLHQEPYDPFLRAETNWITENDTQVYDACCGDLDNDGKDDEVVTVGYQEDDSETAYGQIRIWNLSIDQLNLENSTNYTPWTNSRFRAVEITDIDNDSVNELIITGDYNAGTPKGFIMIWNYTSSILKLEATKVWNYDNPPFSLYVYSLTTGDFDNDSSIEIATIATYNGSAYINIWNSTSGQVLNESQYNWRKGVNTIPQCITSANVTNGPTAELIVGGRTITSPDSGFIDIYNYTDHIDFICGTEWVNGTTRVDAIEVGDLNNDGVLEIAAGGSTKKDSPYTAIQLTIWNVTNNNLLLINDTYWYSSTGYSYCRDVEVADFDQDGSLEVISGSYSVHGDLYAEFRIWNLTGTLLKQEGFKEWTTWVSALAGSTDLYALFTIYCDDFDLDGVNETLIATQNLTDLMGDEIAKVQIWDANNYNLTFEEIITNYDPVNEEIYIQTKIKCSFSGHGYLEGSEVQTATYNIKTYDGFSTGLSGSLTWDAIATNWNATIDVSSLSKGLYYIELFANDGHQSNTTKYFSGCPTEFYIGYNWTNSYNMQLLNSTEWINNSISTLASDIKTADVDGDGYNEIVSLTEIDSTPDYAQLRVWNFTGTQLQLEDTFEWDYFGGSIFRPERLDIGDVTGDNVLEIVCCAQVYNSSNQYIGLINVFNITEGKITNVTSYSWYNYSTTKVKDVKIADIDYDGTNEIITVGYFNTTQYNADLKIWNITNGNLVIEDEINWYFPPANDTTIFTVAVSNIDQDGALEIITGTIYEQDPDNYKEYVQISVFNYSSGSIENETSLCITEPNDISTYDIDCADVDDDGTIEIIVPLKVDTDIFTRIVTLNKTGNTLLIENITDFDFGQYTITFGITIGDIDLDNYKEFIMMGQLGSGSWSDSFFMVFNKTKQNVLIENQTSFNLGTFDSLRAGVIDDIDKNGVPDLITIGKNWYDFKSHACIRIWTAPLIEVRISSIEQDYTSDLIDILNVTVISPFHGSLNDQNYYLAKYTIYNSTGLETNINGTLQFSSLYQKWEARNIDSSLLPDGEYYAIIYFEHYDSLGYSSHFSGDASEFTIDNTIPNFTQVPTDLSYVVGTQGHIIQWCLTEPHPHQYCIYVNGILKQQGFWQSGEPIIFNVDGYVIGTYNITILLNDSHTNFITHQITLSVTKENQLPPYLLGGPQPDWTILVIILAIVGVVITLSALMVKSRRSRLRPAQTGLKTTPSKLVSHDDLIKNILLFIAGHPSVSIEKISEKVELPYESIESLLVSLIYQGELKGFIDDKIFFNDEEFLD